MLVPNHIKTKQVIKLEALESRIESQARAKPSLRAWVKDKPRRNSSLCAQNQDVGINRHTDRQNKPAIPEA